MKQIRKFAALILAFSVLFSLAVPTFAASSVQSEVQSSAAFMLSSVKSPEVGSIGGEWAVIGLARSGYSVPADYYDEYYTRVEKYVKNCSGVLHERKYTEYSRVVLALTAIGRDPSNVAGYNLLMPLGDFDKTIWQGLNGPIWALIALDSGNYDIPKNTSAKTQATRQLYIDEIIKNQMKDGGWSLTGTGDSDVDISAMALQALAKYQDQKAVKTATDKALTYLSKVQDSKGGFASWGTMNVESVAQVIVALCELGISLDDSRFVKNGHTLTENLLSFRQSNGGFYHVLDGSDGNNQMSAEQGFYALVAIDRAENGKNSLYRMGDVTKNTSKPIANVNKGSADASVSVPGVTAPGTTFSDVKNHANQTSIEALASRGIINGMGQGTFMPNKTMTRAEFAAIVTRALGLTAKDTKVFSDVPSSKWYAGYIGAANSSGIVNGVGSGKFNPDGTITRQEAAAMVARAAKLCGLDTEMDAGATKDVLAQFGDYRSVASWAKESLAFCYYTNILDQSALKIEPTKAILRCEIAQMLYNMLTAAELI
ncbi:MAG TPA: hypothetical protein DEQ85_07005 [Clostridiales bacterium]|nr:hypothetical protein [Clostridiales bacterium]